MGDEARVKAIDEGPLKEVGRRPHPDLLRVADLAERWGMEEESVKRFVRESDVPFFWVGRPGKKGKDGVPREHIKWDNVRFRVAAVEKWEADHQETYVARRRPPEKPTGRGAGSLLLGRQR